ncbi:hypothetical protein WN51_02831 [Melipona quadrifasciata]|uniref:Uncharacterized protein n=1 Tax=Melipona quadrifasciata TaxID=166423 RepID=A0A0M9A8S3_9HYME|nr:hypothetical protein WN51_02831 [Melipona quadrifasciata]
MDFGSLFQPSVTEALYSAELVFWSSNSEFFMWRRSSRKSISVHSVIDRRTYEACSIENSRLVGIHRTDIRYNRASLSKIKQREPPGRRILAAALFVRTCKQWNYPFPVRIYPDDSQPVADLPPGKHQERETNGKIPSICKPPQTTSNAVKLS